MGFAYEPIPEDFVLRQLKQLKTNKGSGLDNFSGGLLKDSASAISGSLLKLAPFLLYGNLERLQRYSRKVIAR